jgi:hypothetical protein
VNILPNRLKQLLLAQGPPGIGDKHGKHGEGFRPQPDHFTIGTAQLGAPLIQFKAGKPQHCRSSAFPARGLSRPIAANIRKSSLSHRRITRG